MFYVKSHLSVLIELNRILYGDQGGSVRDGGPASRMAGGVWGSAPEAKRFLKSGWLSFFWKTSIFTNLSSKKSFSKSFDNS